MTPLDEFRAWEANGPFVHVLIIDRGNGLPANRLTLTDVPYIDKGVDGARYHHTYPAPIDCIISDIETNEERSGSDFSDFVLSNAGGRLDDVLGYPNIVDQRFILMRGHPNWSLSDINSVTTFQLIARGQIDEAIKRKGGAEIVLRLSPLRHNMDNIISGVDTPIAFGECSNVSASLVDAANLQYRFSAIPCRDGSHFKPRDRGEALTISTDYSEVTEDGQFKGMVQLVSSPAGDLTADVTQGSSTSALVRTVPVLNYLLAEYGVSNLNMLNSAFDLSSQGSYMRWVITSADGSKMYVHDDVDGFFQYSNADPVSGATYDSKSSDPASGFYSGRLNGDDEYLYLITASNELDLFRLSTPGDISTVGSLLAYVDLGTLAGLAGGDEIRDILVTPDESQAWALSDNGNLYIFDIPATRDIANAALNKTVPLAPLVGYHPGVSQALYLFRLDASADFSRVFIANSEYEIFQINLPTPAAFDNPIVAPRKYILTFDASASKAMRGFCIHPDGDRLYIVRSGNTLEQHDLEDANNLPFRATAWPGRNAITFTDTQNSVGMFLASETQVGAAISELASNVGFSFCIDRLGSIRLTKLFNVDYEAQGYQRRFPIRLGDCIGLEGEFVRQVSSFGMLEKVIGQYNYNYTQQPASNLASGVDVEDADYYGKPYRVVEGMQSLPGLVGSPDKILRANIPPIISSTYGIEKLVESELALWGVARHEFEIDCALRCTSLLDDFGVGELIVLPDGLGFYDFAPEPYIDLPAGETVESAYTTTDSLSGDFTVVVKAQLRDLSDASYIDIAKTGDVIGNLEWSMKVSNGQLAITYTNGFSKSGDAYMTRDLVEYEINKNTPVWLRVHVVLDDGASGRSNEFAYAYTNTQEEPGDGDWVVMETITGSALTGVSRTNAPVIIGKTTANEPMRIHRLIVKSQGDIVADCDPRRWKTGDSINSAVSGETWDLNDQVVRDGYTQMLVTGRRINWSKNRQTLTVFK